MAFKKYGLEFRKRVVESYDSGAGSIREVADDFDVSPTTAHAWIKRNRDGESLQPRVPTQRGREPTIGKRERRWMREWYTKKPDLYFREVVEKFAAKGIKVSASMVHRAKEAMRLSRKKRHSTPRSATPSR
jgi:transposase